MADTSQNLPASNLQPVRVWDLPTRLFHWTLAALMVAQWLTAENSDTMTYHVWGGYTILTLILFRLIWGFAGSDTVRFSQFVRGPAAVIDYVKALLRGETPLYLGHNPAGAWSILAMLALLSVQAVTGLFANDDILVEGPLYGWVSKSTSDWLTSIHKFNFNLLLIVISVHIAAALFYLFVKRENLIHPMLNGLKHLPAGSFGAPPRIASAWLGLAALAVAAVAVWLLVG
ncbi:MAG: cytochrome b/b6 domain-containing protein [Candidatus Competibacteraceae bacterium]|nr:cytochrome b/b6 domain-containing protein [Candidatus Competibacteraceae bacterium]